MWEFRAAAIIWCVCIYLFPFLPARKRGEHFGPSAWAYLPVILLIAIPDALLLKGSFVYAQVFFSFLMSYAVYSALLLALTPLLRKRYSAECCANLWLLPNISLFFLLYGRELLQPFAVLRIGRVWFWALLGVWAAGFLGVLGWKIVSHLRFRRRLLKRAEQDDFLSYVYVEQRYSILTELEKKRNRLPDRNQIVYSPDADSPLSIGLFKRRIVLPKRFYQEEDLQLILRHETTHLLRDDNGTKFFLTFLSACYWFLPFSWLGLSRAAEDLELCCDEIATASLTPEERRRYAELLLSNAGSAPGFTTCLSASAAGLRYRLQRVLHPIKAKPGRTLAFAAAMLFMLSLMLVCFAPGVGGLDSVTFSKVPDAQIVRMRFVEEEKTWQWDSYVCDEAALRDALSQIEAYRADSFLDGKQDEWGEVKFELTLIGETRAVRITFWENAAFADYYKVRPNSTGGIVLKDDDQDRYWKTDGAEQTYLYDTPPDWEALYALAGPPIEH